MAMQRLLQWAAPDGEERGGDKSGNEDAAHRESVALGRNCDQCSGARGGVGNAQYTRNMPIQALDKAL